MDEKKTLTTKKGEEVEALKQQLTETHDALKRTERQLEKSQNYNEELRQQIEKLSSELHVYRSVVQNRQEAECQVDEKDIAEAFGEKPFPDWGVPDESTQTAEGKESGVSIADSLKAAAEEVVWEQAGFVYDSTSGLYYDYNSGYYYDSARSLYYDPATTAYFYYDEAKQMYKFHSYACGQNGEQTSQNCEEGTVEADASENNATPSQNAQKKPSSSREKSHKNKLKEKPKVKQSWTDLVCEVGTKADLPEDTLHKGKIRKPRRRTKSSKHKSKTKVDKIQENCSEETVVVSCGGNGGVLVEDSAEVGQKQKEDQEEDGKEEEPMECESSDSLATGESEIESDPESGELTDESSSSSSSSSGEDDSFDLCADPMHYDTTANKDTESDIAASYPPCIRVIVQSSEAVAVGTFFLVTCPGGTIGRDSDSRHAIQLPEVNVSKVHAEVKYDSDNGCYTVEDLGSQNGTFVNDLRISQSKERSAAIPLSHGDILQVASTHMLLHIHPGTDTCDNCEPGQVMAALRAQQTTFNDHVVLSKEEKKKQARRQLKEIKKKYGLANSAYVDDIGAIKHPGYADKAELRRRFIGSEHHSHQQGPEIPASVHRYLVGLLSSLTTSRTLASMIGSLKPSPAHWVMRRPISADNKGHRMLAKMGWKEGRGLGKDNAGRAEPVTVELRANQTAGLGSASSAAVSLDHVQSVNKIQRRIQTQERYQRLENSDAQLSTSEGAGTSARKSESLGNSKSGMNFLPTGGANGTSSQRSGGANTSHPGRGLNRKEMKWIQGETQNPT